MSPGNKSFHLHSSSITLFFFSFFYGQRTVTAAWATRSPWSIVTVFNWLLSALKGRQNVRILAYRDQGIICLHLYNEGVPAWLCTNVLRIENVWIHGKMFRVHIWEIIFKLVGACPGWKQSDLFWRYINQCILVNLMGLILVFCHGGGWKSHATLAKGIIDHLNKWSDIWLPRNRGSVPINL